MSNENTADTNPAAAPATAEEKAHAFDFIFSLVDDPTNKATQVAVAEIAERTESMKLLTDAIRDIERPGFVTYLSTGS